VDDCSGGSSSSLVGPTTSRYHIEPIRRGPKGRIEFGEGGSVARASGKSRVVVVVVAVVVVVVVVVVVLVVGVGLRPLS